MAHHRASRQAQGDAALNLGELAARTGATVETVRDYERTGVLPKPPRSTSWATS